MNTQPSFRNASGRPSIFPGIFFALLLGFGLKGASSLHLEQPPAIAVQVPSAVLQAGPFTLAEQTKITSYRDLILEVSYRGKIPYELANGLAAENETAPFDKQVLLTGWSKGYPVLMSGKQCRARVK